MQPAQPRRSPPRALLVSYALLSDVRALTLCIHSPFVNSCGCGIPDPHPLASRPSPRTRSSRTDCGGPSPPTGDRRRHRPNWRAISRIRHNLCRKSRSLSRLATDRRRPMDSSNRIVSEPLPSRAYPAACRKSRSRGRVLLGSHVRLRPRRRCWASAGCGCWPCSSSPRSATCSSSPSPTATSAAAAGSGPSRAAAPRCKVRDIAGRWESDSAGVLPSLSGAAGTAPGRWRIRGRAAPTGPPHPQPTRRSPRGNRNDGLGIM